MFWKWDLINVQENALHGINLPGHTQEERYIAVEPTVICPSLGFSSLPRPLLARRK